MLDSKKTKNKLIAELQEARKKLESQDKQSVSQSEDVFAKAFRASPDMIIITSIPGGVYLEVNDAFARKVGHTREELIGHNLGDFNFFVSGEETEKMMDMLHAQGGFRNVEFKFRVPSGEIQYWLCSAEIVNLNGEDRMISVATDISNHKKMLEALEESKQILGMAFYSSPQAMGITKWETGQFIDVNKSLERVSGYTREELIGHTANDLNIWGKPEYQDEIAHLMLKNNRISNREMQIRKKSGQIYPVLFSAQIIKIRGESCVITSLTDLSERVEMEKALRESEEKFSKAFISGPNPVCLINVKDTRFLEVNDSFLRFTGFSREELVGHTTGELHLWALENERDAMAHDLYATGKLVNVIAHCRTKTGEIRTGMFSAQFFDVNGKANMILSINDITDQIKAEEAIANEAILRRILIQNSRDGIVILTQEGKVFEANRKYCEMLGYTSEEIKNLSAWDWECITPRKDLLERLQKVGDEGDHFETKHRRKDGSLYDVEISTNGAVIAGQKLVFCVCRDITQRKKMEKALRESEEMFSKAFHASPEISAITTLNDGIYIDVNENYSDFTGYSREELIGHTATELGIWARVEQRDDMFRTMAEQGRVSKKEYLFRTKSGEIRTWLFSAMPVTIADVPCLMGVSIDITDQKLIEAKVQEAENLKEVERLRRELLSNVSHELRTPLASIKGFASILIDYNKRLKAKEKLEYLVTIDNNADRMVELIEQLLEVSRLGAGMVSIHKKPTDIKGLCRATITAARKRASGHLFLLNLPKKMPLIDLDEDRIRQVLDHVIDNAVKYSKPGTQITLSVRKTTDDVIFVVADQGSGISDEDMPHIFERMFTSPNRSKSGVSGAGLGLTISKGLIEAHHGKIWIESKVGVGSKCFFTLPLTSSTAEPVDK
jgi:PAS domain S-box-containing protein